MNIKEFMKVVAFACHIIGPAKAPFSSEYKRECSAYFVNCAIRDDEYVSNYDVTRCESMTYEHMKNWKD